MSSVGSSISQNKIVARIFSHRSSLASRFDDGTIKHKGTRVSCLYVVAEEMGPDDADRHPANVGGWE